ncbi:MAG: tetratricopeptide repeat protein [Gammaproteobacteria bacterium]|nr:MAG: tetratricopeptide repeat protein [Gammaproteobacteria bacterium]
MRRFSLSILFLLAAFAAGCAALPPAPAPKTPEEKVASTPVSSSGAVVALADSARTDVAAGNYASASAALERALRIEPRNARLWHELAQLKLKQGDASQAANMAARSNSWAGADKVLRAANWRVIGEAKRALGDETGANAAFDKADKLIR